jgi:two-component system response regulator BaeR
MTDPVVIVEDEVKIARLLRDYCEQAGYPSIMIHDGDEALHWLQNNRARMVLLDLMLPGTDGLTICQNLRKHSEVPVIMITAQVEEIDRLLGLGLGADDYVCKPFSPREVIARMKVILRRVEKEVSTVRELVLNEDSLEVSFADRSVELTAVEFRLFKTLFDSPGRIYARDHLMSHIYADNRIVSDRTIDSHVKKLRKKLLELGVANDPVCSVYGVGYKYEA